MFVRRLLVAALVAAVVIAVAGAALVYRAKVTYRVVPSEGFHNFSADFDLGTIEAGSSGRLPGTKFADWVTDGDGATVTITLTNTTELSSAFSQFDVTVSFYLPNGTILVVPIGFDFPQNSVKLPADSQGEAYLGIVYTAKDVSSEVSADALEFLEFEWS